MRETLKRLGITENEVEIYLTTLNAKELSVNDIAMKSGLHRQVCYDALDRLLEKGFVSYIKKENKRFFKALAPQKILDYLDEKKDEVKEILPELEELYEQEKEETEVEVIKGKKVIRTIYNDILRVLLKTKKPLLAIGIDETKFLEFDRIAIKQHILRMKQNNLKEKLLAKEGARELFEGTQSEYRFLPAESFNPNPTHIYGDNVATIVWGTPTYGIIIRSKQVADANRKYFDILWRSAEKTEHTIPIRKIFQ